MFVEGKNACVRRLAQTELRPPAPPRLCTFRRGRALPSEPPRSAVFRHAALLAARRNKATCGLSRPRLLRRQRRRGRGCRRSGSTGRGSEQRPRARTSCRPCSALTCVLRLPPPPLASPVCTPASQGVTLNGENSIPHPSDSPPRLARRLINGGRRPGTDSGTAPGPYELNGFDVGFGLRRDNRSDSDSSSRINCTLLSLKRFSGMTFPDGLGISTVLHTSILIYWTITSREPATCQAWAKVLGSVVEKGCPSLQSPRNRKKKKHHE